MASSILPLVNGETTSSLLSGGIVPTATTSAIAGTGTALYVIDGKKGEREFKPKRYLLHWLRQHRQLLPLQ